MKLQICAEIEGNFLLRKEINAKLYPYEFVIFLKDDKYYISVTKPVKDYIDFAPKMYVKDDMVHIEATKPAIYADLEQWLYYIEAMGAFNFEVTKIHLDELEIKWIYESDEEKGSIPLTSLKRNKEKKKADKYVSNSNLSNLVIYRRVLQDAHIPFSYYRQAKKFFDEDDYYFAFVNYFMMIEFCFAGGAFRQDEVAANFKKSDLLKLCILQALKLIRESEESHNYQWVYNECISKNKNVNVDGVIYLLIKYRGLLSHASEKSKKFLFDNMSLRPLALFISVICFFLCGNIQIYSCSSKESKERRIRELIDKLQRDIS